MRFLCGPRLLVIDEFAYARRNPDPEANTALFEVISRRSAPRRAPAGPTMMIRTCATCGAAITVTTRNPNRRYCTPRCRVADWHARNHGNGDGIVDGANDVRDGVQPRNAVPDAVQAANGVARCPHCRQELAVVAVVIPADAAHVKTPEVIT